MAMVIRDVCIHVVGCTEEEAHLPGSGGMHRSESWDGCKRRVGRGVSLWSLALRPKPQFPEDIVYHVSQASAKVSVINSDCFRIPSELRYCDPTVSIRACWLRLEQADDAAGNGRGDSVLIRGSA